MEICKIQISKEVLQILVDSNAITTDDFTVIGVNEDLFDYTTSELWKTAKEKSDKAYRQLKEIEFKIRHNIKD
jgi:hypothetical protein